MFFKAGLARIEELPLDSPLPCIVIPHIHPGYFARTDMSPAFHKVAFLSWIASWVHMHAAVHLLQVCPGIGIGSRKALCEAIVGKADKTLREAGFYSLLLDTARLASAVKNPIRLADSALLAQVKDDGTMKSLKRKRLLEWHLTTHTTTNPVTQLPGHSSENGAHLQEFLSQPELRFSNSLERTQFIAAAERCGRARGERHSDERAKQAQELYDAGIPRFYHCQNRDIWDKIILDQPRNSWLVGCLEALEE